MWLVLFFFFFFPDPLNFQVVHIKSCMCRHSPVQICFLHSWDLFLMTRTVQGTQKTCFQEHAGYAAFELVAVSLMEIAL